MIRFFGASLWLLILNSPALASETVRDNEPMTPSEQSPQVDSEHLFTRKWRGARSWLAERGVQIEPVYKGDLVTNSSGGLASRTTFLGNFDLKAEFNAEKLVGWTGGTWFFYGLYNHGGKPSQFIGDTQVTSNIEAPATTAKVYEAWIQQAVLDEKLSLLLGLHDLNSEFYVTETSTLFTNSSFGIGKDFSQTGANGPSIFPTTSLAARVRGELEKIAYLQVGVWDAVAGDPENALGTQVNLSKDEGALFVAEVAHQAENRKYGVGYYRYTAKFDHLLDVDANGAPLQSVSQGIYFLSEQEIVERLSFFARYGFAAAAVNPIVSNLSAGIVGTGLIPGLDADRVGLALTLAYTGAEYRTARTAAGLATDYEEKTFEMTYRLELGRGIALQPDFQYVINPGAEPSLENASVFAMRFEVAL